MSALTQFKEQLKQQAGLLGDYQNISTNDLADNYCLALDSGDKEKQNKYISAIALRYWNYVLKLYNKSQRLKFDYDDSFDLYYEGINLACQYRAWQNPEKNTNAEACIKQCIETVWQRTNGIANFHKNKSAYAPSISFDAPIKAASNQDGREETLLDVFAGDHLLSASDADISVRSLIQQLINNGKIMSAIMADVIAFADIPSEKRSNRTIKIKQEDGSVYKYKEFSHEFWAYQLVKNMNELPQNYAEYFQHNYHIKDKDLQVVLDYIKKASNGYLYKNIKKLPADLKELYFAENC